MRRSFCAIVVGFGLFFLGGIGHAQDTTITTIRSQMGSGNVKGALKKANKLLLQTLALKIQALAKLGRAKKALQAYEVLVSLEKRENFPLLKAVAWAQIMNILKKKHPKAKELAADFLGELGDKRAVKPLLRLLKSSRFLTRLKAAEALGKIGDKSAVASVLRLMKDSSGLVRTSAAWALGALGEKKGIAYLKKCYKTKRGGAKLRCAFMLAKLKNRSVLRYFQKELRSNSNRRARAVIAESLSFFGKNRRWVKLVSKDVRARNEASRLISVRALGELKARRARRALQRALKDKSITVRIAAAKSLGQIGHRRGSSVLLKSLKHSSSLYRADAALALSFVKDRKTQKALIRILGDKSLLVRLNAGHALVQLRRQEGGGAFREGLMYGNLPLQVIAAKFAILAAKSHSQRKLKGHPVERFVGTVPRATKTKAFDENEPLPGDDDDDGSSFSKKGKKAKSSRTNRSAKRTTKKSKSAKRGKTKRRKPPKRRSADDDDDDDW